MLKKILIANRGEIAIRIIRTCREMNIETVAVYSTEDKHQLHVTMADQSVCIGPKAGKDSYLNMDNIIEVAKKLNCDGIHPGYGFLSENSEFVKKVEAEGIKFIGPSSEVINLMGEKSNARKLMIENNIPVVPGSNGKISDLKSLKDLASEIGYPVLIKAANGGGGKGMRAVYKEEDLESSFSNAKKEAKSSFGNDDMYMEKLIENPKHIEFQILADSYGNVIHLGERECSIQRKNQKMIEESPSTFLDEILRKEMGEISKKVAKICNYENAGTIEFVVDKDKNFYFIEMNTRIQVEHPVTEMVTGIDLIKEQIKIASKLKLSKTQEDIKIDGHAIEIRVNAEDELNDFRPCPGNVDFVLGPNGFNTRFDSYLYPGCKVSPFYDSMIGKIIVKGDTKLEAVRRLRRAIEETIITGVPTNLGVQYVILHDPKYLKGDFNTNYINENLEKILESIKGIR